MSALLLLLPVLVVLGVVLFVKTSPVVLARRLRYLGAGVLFLAGLYLSLRGTMMMAAPLFGLSAWLFRTPGSAFSFFGRGQRRSGQRSEVRSLWLHMVLDHDTGMMEGTVTGGPYAGRPLRELSPEDLAALREACREEDPEGVRLLDAYQERLGATEKENPQSRNTSGEQQKKDRRKDSTPDPEAGADDMPMTKAQAYEILGLQAGCTQEDIRRAHRMLMLKRHPDQGGSDYLAARLNRARELLL